MGTACLNQANKDGKEMYAKIQACCSHEIATLPYIPVPGILFDKLKVDIAGMMECWYFGNYPSLMSKVAGLEFDEGTEIILTVWDEAETTTEESTEEKETTTKKSNEE